MTRFRLVLATAVLVATVTGPIAPGAEAAEETTCKVTGLVLEITPGMSNRDPSSGSFYSTTPGRAECEGRVQGADPTGPGVYTVAGRYGTEDPDTCSAGEGWGVNRVEFPTDSGTKVVRSAFTAKLGGDKLVTGTFDGDYTSGTFDLIRPTKGDCVSTPVTEGAFDLTMTIHDYRPPK